VIGDRPELEKRLKELERENAELRRENAELRALVEQLLVQIEALKEELGRDSTNSSQPPSQDPPAARQKRRKRKKGARKRGGQKGHKGHHRELIPADEVDTLIDLFPEHCRACGAELGREADTHPERHQVVEVPPLRPEVTEYRLHRVGCPCCGTVNARGLPKGVSWSPFGPRLTSIVGLFTGVYRLSKRNAKSLLEDLLGVRLSLGALSQSEQRLSRALDDPVSEAVDYVQQQTVRYTDSTSWRQGRRRLQLWTLASALVTVFRITADGTRETFKKLIGKVRGVLVSDRAAVFGFWSMKHWQVCWAHLLRGFVAFSDREGGSRAVGEGLLKQTKRIFAWWHRVRDGTLARSSFRTYLVDARKEVKRLLQMGAECDHPKTRGTCRKLLSQFEAMWTFARIEGVEPTNNHSERELRSAVIWRKTSFATQSQRGNRYIERIMTTAATLRKQGRNILEYLTAAYNAALRNETPPSLLPSKP
jgi:transposase